MARGISDEISLCLDDAAAEPRAAGIVDEQRADQEARERDGVGRKLVTPDRRR
jgi:hypothetical protein